MNKIILSFVLFASSLLSLKTAAQQHIFEPTKQSFSKTYQQLALPLAFVTYGIMGIESDGLQNIDHNLRNHIQQPQINFRTGVDNYLQFSPAAAVFALNAAGVKGENNLFDSSRIYLTSTILMAGTVSLLKHSVGSLRPDGSAYNSFPSGHTATAFAAAEFLHQEFKNSSHLLSYSGYLAASATGTLRMFNDKHYLSDVIAGAGIGILSTKAAYWINKKVFEKKHPSQIHSTANLAIK